MKKGVLFIFGIFIILITLNQILALNVEDSIPIQIQTTDTPGNIITGTFNFTINISNSSTCSPVLYSNTTTKTTDARGIVSYNLENVSLEFDEQYWFCYYRDSVLKQTTKIARTPYAFRAKNITLSGIEVDSNFNLGSYNFTTLGNVGIGTASPIHDLTIEDGQARLGIISTNDDTNVGIILRAHSADSSVTDGGLYYISDDVDADSFIALSGDNANYDLVVTQGTGNVGIGTTSPGVKLDINNTIRLRGNSATDSGMLYFTKGSGGGTTAAWHIQAYHDGLDFVESGVLERMFIQNGTGNVGIGTTNPSQKLDVLGAIQLSNNTGSNEAGTIRWTGTEFQAYNGTSWNTFGTTGGGASTWSQSGDDIYYNNGNVGIGTTSPTRPLVINSDNNPLAAGYGSILIYGDSNKERIDVQSAGGDPGFLGRGAGGTYASLTATEADKTLAFLGGTGYNGSNWVVGSKAIVGLKSAENWNNTAQGAYITFETTPMGSTTRAERVRITDAGKVGIGTASPGALLEIEADQDTTEYIHLTGHDNDSVGIRPVLKFKRSNGSLASPSLIISGSDIGSILAAGYDGTLYQNLASINFAVDGETGANDMPGKIEFKTTPDGSVTRVTRMTIKNDGRVGIGTTSPIGQLDVIGDINFFNQSSSPMRGISFETDSAIAQKMYSNWGGGIGADLQLGTYDYQDAIYIDNTNGNVGIGTTSPAGLLHIGGSTAEVYWDSTYSTMNYRIKDGNTLARITYGGTDEGALELYDSNAIAVFIAANGYTYFNGGSVGIGTTSPLRLLHLDGGSDSYARFDTSVAGKSNWTIGADTHGFVIYEEGGDYRFMVEEGGNVGIGTDSPTYKLDVYDATNDISARIQTDKVNGNVGLHLQNDAQDWHIYNNINDDLVFWDDTNDKSPFVIENNATSDTLYIDSTGYVGIGTASPEKQLHIYNSDSATIQLTDMSGAADEEDVALTNYNGQFLIQQYNSDGTWKQNPVTIDTTGYVGIFVADPHSALEVNGAISSGYVTITADSDAVDVSGVNSVFVDTTDNHITIGGLAGGVIGQAVHLIKSPSGANNMVIEHNEGTGTQKILTYDGSDQTFTVLGGMTVVFTGTNWFQVSGP